MAQPLTRCKGPYKLDKRKLVQGESGWSIYADLHTEYYDIHICKSDVLYKMEVNNVNIRQWSPDFFLYGVYLNRALLVKYNTAFYSMSWACVLSYLPFFYLFLAFLANTHNDKVSWKQTKLYLFPTLQSGVHVRVDRIGSGRVRGSTCPSGSDWIWVCTRRPLC